MGIMPDIIIARVDEPLEEAIWQKIALFCNVKPDCVIENLTLPVLYEAPLMLERSHLAEIVCRELHLDCPPCDLTDWNAMLARIAARRRSVTHRHCGQVHQAARRLSFRGGSAVPRGL